MIRTLQFDQFDGAEDRLDFLIAAGGNDPHRHAAQLLKRNGHHALVDRMVNKRAGVIVEIVKQVADGAQADQGGAVFFGTEVEAEGG